MESAGLDPEQLAPPKEYWFDEAELKRWFEERKQLAKELMQTEN